MPKISVIVPVYNVEKYIHRCIDSILAQTFSDFELILVDDGSKDNSGKICDEYSEKDSRIKVFHQQNAGQSAARNKGVEISHGEYICFIDGDDIVNPYILERLFNALSENGTGAAVANRIYGIEPEKDFFENKDGQTLIYNSDEETLLSLYDGKNTLYWTLFPCIMKKEIYLKNPLAPGRVMEDNAVACKWLCEAKKTAFVDTPLYFYRNNPNGTMNAKFSPKKLDFLWALEEQLKFFDGIGYRKICNAVAGQYINDSIWLSGRVYKELNNKKLAKQTIDKMRENIKKYAPDVKISEEQERKIFKLLHPVLHKIKKKQIKRLPS